MAIRILVTGGTFDKEYNEIDGSLFFKDTHLQEILKLGRAKVDVKISQLMLMDSLDMKDGHREEISRQCKECEEERIIITHGTDTMVETAKYIAERIKDKTVVLAGAMVPFAFGSSDGLFNIGAALAFAQSLPPGVYVAMNGRYFKYNNVRKNKQTGIFEEIS